MSLGIMLGIVVGIVIVILYGIYYCIKGIYKWASRDRSKWDITILEPEKLRAALWDKQETPL